MFKLNHSVFLFTLLLMTWQSVQAQSCVANYPQTTPDEQFTVHNDGTVTDKQTGLMWQQCLLGLSGTACEQGSAQSSTWEGALQQAGQIFAGYSDWRLPNVKELLSIVEKQCSVPAINLTIFPNSPSSYVWSSSPHANGSNYAWGVDFGHGTSNRHTRGSNLRVRLVRSGQ
jgi:hypothetical protein